MDTTREAWLLACADKLRPLFERAGAAWPKFRVTMSEISQREIVGRCYSPRVSQDNTAEIVIRLDQTKPEKLAGILAHELAHASVGVAHGHRRPFVRLVRAIGLDGKPTATHPGPKFKEDLREDLLALGPFPGARLDLFAHLPAEDSTHKKEGTRLLKVTCPACGYVCRVTAKWILVGLPLCPIHGPMVQS